MNNLAFIHRGSRTARMLIDETQIPRWGRGVRADFIINYGVAGDHWRRWVSNNRLGRTKPMLNAPHGMNKFEVIKHVEENEYKVPLTFRQLDRIHAPEAFLVKPFFSQQGRGIERAESRYAPSGKYFQEFIEDRVYELRVHAFRWVPQSEWVVQKRVAGEDQEDAITWNHHTGGTFITVNDTSQRVFEDAQAMANAVLHRLNMAFGGVDFVVSASRDVYFIEVNSAVGCCGLSDPIYVDAFNRLKYVDRQEVEGYATA